MEFRDKKHYYFIYCLLGRYKGYSLIHAFFCHILTFLV